jgi:hypothetical protein
LHARAAASCDVWYRHRTKVRSCAPAPPPVATFGTATVPKSAVAHLRRRQLRRLVPPRYQSPKAAHLRRRQLRRLVPPDPDDNPFATLDVKSIGKLIEIGPALGRRTRPELEVGI